MSMEVEPSPEREQPLRIVVIDDDLDVLLLCRVNLEMEGFEVHLATGGAEGIELIAACDPDAVVLDVMMPNIDGFEVLRAIRAEPTTRNLPVVILSVRASDADHTQGHDSGADAYISKPFVPSELVLALNKAVEHRVTTGPSINASSSPA